MTKGGYQIIDFKNVQFDAGVGIVFDGVYDKVSREKKALLVSGLNFEGREFNDFFATVEVAGTELCLMYYSESYDTSTKLYINIADTDVVTINEG